MGYGFNSLTGGYMDSSISTGEFFASYIQNPSNFNILDNIIISISFCSNEGNRVLGKDYDACFICFGIILCIRSLTLGAPVNPDWSSLKGLNFIWNPDFSQLSWGSAIAASGQIFFTLSLGMGIIQNYASYLKPDEDIITASVATISLNEFAEVILGGTAVIPIAYAFFR